jgi:peptidoglycan hydrolase-like protein with peptidoglycan-binding domain
MIIQLTGEAVRATAADFQRIADDIAGGDVNKVYAVWQVEAPRGPFYRLQEGMAPSALYEPHIAWRNSSGGVRTYLASLGLAAAKWGAIKYGSYGLQYARLRGAAAVDQRVAFLSASVGGPQILGTNYKAVGFAGPEDMWKAFAASEANQLRAFAAFLKRNGLDKHLKAGNWTAFARGYNGPSYATHNYHGRLKAAYDVLRKSGTIPAEPLPQKPNSRDPNVIEAQNLLKKLGYNPGKVDGWFGKETKAAVLEFQRSHPDLHNDGALGPHTLAALRKAVEAQDAKAPAETGAAATGAAGAMVSGAAAAAGLPWYVWLFIGLAAMGGAYLIWRWYELKYGPEVEAVENAAESYIVERPPLADRIGEHFSVLSKALGKL